MGLISYDRVEGYEEWEIKMLAEIVKKWEQDITTQAKFEGAMRIFVLQLEKRFGKVPPDIIELIKLFDLQQIEVWSVQLLGAKKVTEVFKDLYDNTAGRN